MLMGNSVLFLVVSHFCESFEISTRRVSELKINKHRSITSYAHWHHQLCTLAAYKSELLSISTVQHP